MDFAVTPSLKSQLFLKFEEYLPFPTCLICYTPVWLGRSSYSFRRFLRPVQWLSLSSMMLRLFSSDFNACLDSTPAVHRLEKEATVLLITRWEKQSQVSSLTLFVLPQKVIQCEAAHTLHSLRYAEKWFKPVFNPLRETLSQTWRSFFMLLPPRGGKLLKRRAVRPCGWQSCDAFMPFGHEVTRHERETVPFTASRFSLSVHHPLFHDLLQIWGRWKLPLCKFRGEITCWNGSGSKQGSSTAGADERDLLKYLLLKLVLQQNEQRNLGAFSSGSPRIYGHFCYTLFPLLHMLADLSLSQLPSKLFLSVSPPPPTPTPSFNRSFWQIVNDDLNTKTTGSASKQSVLRTCLHVHLVVSDGVRSFRNCRCLWSYRIPVLYFFYLSGDLVSAFGKPVYILHSMVQPATTLSCFV